MRGSTGRAALGSAAPWLLLGGLVLFLVIAAKDELGKGGLIGWLKKLLGLEPPGPIEQDTPTQQDAAGQDHESGGVGSAAVTGFFNLESGESIDMDNEWATLGQSVVVPISLVNSSPSRQVVLVNVHVYADYLISDEERTWSELITVDGLSGKQLGARVLLPSAFPGSRPTLYVDLTIAGVHQDRIENVKTSIG
jgi:hypothetical protein